MLKKIGFLLCIIVIIINLLNYNFDLDFSDNDNKISLIGVLASLCALVLIVISMISDKISKKIKD